MSMQVIDWPDFLDNDKQSGDSAMTIGFFDGVHLGHQALIQKIVSNGQNPTVITFRECPKKVLSPETYKGDVFSLKQKLNAFEQRGVSRVVLIDFSGNFSKLNGRDFLDLLEKQGEMAFLVIGSNFRCGYHKGMDAEAIAAVNELKGIPTEVLAPVNIPPEFGTGPVNSSRIRSAVVSGDLRMAAVLMGRNFELDISGCSSRDAQCGGSGVKVYDLDSVPQVIPPDGQYPVKTNPGYVKSLALIQGKKLRLSVIPEGEAINRADSYAGSLEFI